MDFGAIRTIIYLYVSIISFIWIGELASNVSSDGVMDKMQQVKENILKNYDKYIRPTNGTNTTIIQFDYVPQQIIEFNEERSTITVVGYLNMSWLDPRLAWNESEFDGYLALPRDLLWVPEVYPWSGRAMQLDPTNEALLGLHPSGEVVWLPPIMIETECDSWCKFQYLDRVWCFIELGSWAYDGWSLKFNYSHDALNEEFLDINPRWELKEMKSSLFTYTPKVVPEPEPNTYVHVFLHLERRPVAEIEATRAPCILVMLLTLAIFWLPPDSSLKLILGGILFLVLNLLLVYVAWSTKFLLAVAFAVSFIQTTMYLVVATLLLQVFVVIKLGALSGPSRPPAAVLHYLKGALGRYACLRSPMAEDRLSLDRVQLKDDAPSAEDSPREEWKLFAAAIDRALFLLMVIAMVSVHHL